MEDLAIVALVGVISLFLVFFLLIVGVAVGVAVVIVGYEKRRSQRRWRIRAPWMPLTYPVFVPLVVLNEQETEKPEAPVVS
jgi:ABC-type Fe3+ transport system permease subunit